MLLIQVVKSSFDTLMSGGLLPFILSLLIQKAVVVKTYYYTSMKQVLHIS